MRRSFSLSLLLALLLAGCPKTNGGPTDGGTGPLACVDRTSCAGGQVCAAEKFCTDCASSGQCLLKEVCSPDTKRCGFRDGWGDQCQSNDQCQAGQWCKQGLCSDRTLVNLCPSGASSECPTHDRCNVQNGVCEEDLGCALDADCGAQEVCNKGSHICVPRCTPDTQSSVCGGGEKCVNSLCAQCAVPADCGAGLICDAAGRCSSAARCYSDRDCKVPLVCYSQTGECLEKLPPCVSDDGCASSDRCDLGTGKCVPRACQPDRYEPNNTPATAFPAKGGGYLGLTLCPGDVDYFALTLSRGDQLGVNVTADPFAESTFTTAIQDSAGRTLGSGLLLASFVAAQAGTYTVGISTSDAYQPYDVNFLISRGTPCTDDAFEPNDTQATATPVNGTSSLDGAICPQDQDWFRLTVPSGKGLHVSLVNYLSSAGLLRLCVSDGATQLGCSEDLTLPEVSVDASVAAGKILYATVSGTQPGLANTYTLQVEYP